MYVHIDTEARATFFPTLEEAQAAWLAGRGEGSVARMLTMRVAAVRQYDTRRRNPERDTAIADAAKSGQRAADIAKTFGLTRERVRQVLKREGAPTKPAPRLPYHKTCEGCGVVFTSQEKAARYCSRPCANRAKSTPIVDGCRECRKCHEMKPLADFPVNSKSGALRPYCRPCNNRRMREYLKRRREEARP